MKFSFDKDNRQYELEASTCNCLENLREEGQLDIDIQEFDEKNPNLCLVFGYTYDDGDYNIDDEWLSCIVTDYKFIPIKYCPICGKKIDLQLSYQDKKVKTRRK